MEVDKALFDFVLVCSCLELFEAQYFLAQVHEIFIPIFLFSNKFKEQLFLFDFGSLFLILQRVDSLVINEFILLSNFLLLFEQFSLLFFGKFIENSRSPLHVVNILLKSILSDNFTNHVPNLVTFFSS